MKFDYSDPVQNAEFRRLVDVVQLHPTDARPLTLGYALHVRAQGATTFEELKAVVVDATSLLTFEGRNG